MATESVAQRVECEGGRNGEERNQSHGRVNCEWEERIFKVSTRGSKCESVGVSGV